MSVRPRENDVAGPGFAVARLGILVAAIGAAGLFLPFALFRANRIVPGDGVRLFDALPLASAAGLCVLLLACMALALLRLSPAVKLIAGLAGLAGLAIWIGAAADHLTPPDENFARVSPASGFWLLVTALTLLVVDSLTRLSLRPLARVALLAGALAAMMALLASGLWDNLSVMKEYGSRASVFWKEANTHLILAFGSVGAASAVGIPLGILAFKVESVRAPVLNVLNIVQTIPSIALFGLLIAPLAWLAANMPGAAAIGVSGIGMAPALVALFAYALLPVVSNTLVGLLGVSPAATDAARGMGMTAMQRLFGIELPLAFPVMLAGIRIVLVQNIGLATIAALIGGGGFGVFVFQGIGQTAMDLVLLGAMPTVVLAFAAAIVLDAAVEATGKGRR